MREYSKGNDLKASEIRKDAISNRKAIIAAVRKLIEKGKNDANLKEIANEAGVSRATLYRNFPDKESIILEVFNENLIKLDAYSRKLKDQPDRFIKLLEVVIKQQSKFQAIALQIVPMDLELRKRLNGIFQEPLSQAKNNGTIRADFNLNKDLLLLLTMVGGALQHEEGIDKNKKVRRVLDFILQGIKN
jgi:AcrR family transcriptional regulator